MRVPGRSDAQSMPERVRFSPAEPGPMGWPAADSSSITSADHRHSAWNGRIHHLLRGQPRVRTQIVLTRLAELNPGVYEGWSFSDLKTALTSHGVQISKSHGHSVIRARDVTHALTRRDTTHNRNGEPGAGN
jgi:DNA segregation ATPase FtsK/SpoIIIE, S-DNA-T family